MVGWEAKVGSSALLLPRAWLLPAPSLVVEMEAHTCDCHVCCLSTGSIGCWDGHPLWDSWGKRGLTWDTLESVFPWLHWLSLMSTIICIYFNHFLTIFGVHLLKSICRKSSVFEGNYNFSQQELFTHSINSYCASTVYVRVTVLRAEGTAVMRHCGFLPSWSWHSSSQKSSDHLQRAFHITV